LASWRLSNAILRSADTILSPGLKTRLTGDLAASRACLDIARRVEAGLLNLGVNLFALRLKFFQLEGRFPTAAHDS